MWCLSKYFERNKLIDYAGFNNFQIYLKILSFHTQETFTSLYKPGACAEGTPRSTSRPVHCFSWAQLLILRYDVFNIKKPNMHKLHQQQLLSCLVGISIKNENNGIF